MARRDRLGKNGKIRKDERDAAQKLGFARGFNAGYDEGFRTADMMTERTYVAAMTLLDQARMRGGPPIPSRTPEPEYIEKVKP